ncbi:LysR family transcriptional regulator [Streptomyces sp. NPDC091281]|uniref:LysR family transcriptional regulator n=1 Tax=Streptomyces sp. NPDC091281 TaxID=3365985 RepID=UPI0037FC675F
METRLLRTFAALARTGTFTAAAADLHLAQSTVTVQIRALEKELGVRLFDRLPSGTVLTDAGGRLLERARLVLDAEEELRHEARAAAPLQGRVTLGASESLCAYRLPLAVAALGRGLPAVEIHMRPVVTPAEAARHLRSGRIDFALLLEEEVAEPYVETEVVGHEPLALVAAPGHPLAGLAEGEVTAERLGGETYFLLEEGCSYSDAFARRLAAGPGRPRVTRFGSVEAVRSCVEAGLGLSLLPEVGVRGALDAGRLRVVGAPGAFPAVAVRMLWLRGLRTAPAARTVRDRLRRAAADGWTVAG